MTRTLNSCFGESPWELVLKFLFWLLGALTCLLLFLALGLPLPEVSLHDVGQNTGVYFLSFIFYIFL